MTAAVITALCVFGFMALFAVFAGIIAAISTVSGFSKPEDSDD